MDHLRRARHLVQVVDILGDNGHVVPLLEFGHEPVALIGLHAPALLAEHVVEIGYQCGVGLPALVRGHLGHGVVLPQSVGIAESLQTAFHGHACACQYYNLFHLTNCFMVCDFCAKIRKKGKKQRMKGLKNEKKDGGSKFFTIHSLLFTYLLYLCSRFLSVHIIIIGENG